MAKTQYDNTDRGALWFNARKERGDNRPDFSGVINVNGEEYWLSMWDNEDGHTENDAAPIYRIAVTAKESDDHQATRAVKKTPPRRPAAKRPAQAKKAAPAAAKKTAAKKPAARRGA